jgi:hypothetical protein
MSQSTNTNRAAYMADYRARKRASETESSRLAKQIEKSYREARQSIEEAMLKASPGTAVFLKHVESLAKLNRAEREELAARGLTPQNLGNGIRQQWVFRAVIAKDGNTTTVEIQPGQAAPRNEMRRLNEDPEERARIIKELEVEYPTDAPLARPEEEE